MRIRALIRAAAALCLCGTARAQSPTLFADDFVSDTAPAWQIVQGQSVSLAPYQLGLANDTRVETGNLAWSDYAVQASVMFLDVWSRARLYFRVQSPGDYYYFEINAQTNNSSNWYIIRATNFTEQLLVGGFVNIGLNVKYTMRVRAVGSQITAEASDEGFYFEPLAQISDTSLPTGRIGLEGGTTPDVPTIFGGVIVLDLSQGELLVPPRPCPTGAGCPYNMACQGSCVCYAGGDHLEMGAYDGCDPALATGDIGSEVSHDSAGNHWKVINSVVDFTGTVNAGSCDPAVNFGCAYSTCPFPAVAGDDDPLHHLDRDLEFHITPDAPFPSGGGPLLPSTGGPLLPSTGLQLLTNRNLFGNPAKGPRDIGVEWEWMFMFPLWSSRLYINSNGDLWPTGRLPLVKDGTKVGVPVRGDRMTIRGRHILDCGHASVFDAIAEIHPPMAMAWMHPDDADPHSGMVYLRMSLKYTRPSPVDTSFAQVGPFSAAFQIPGGPNGQKAYVAPVQSDWMVVPNGLLVTCDDMADFDFPHPWAHFDYQPCPSWFDMVMHGSAPILNQVPYNYMRDGDLAANFLITTFPPDANGNVALQVQARPVDPLKDDWGLGGAHFQICYPQCTSRRVKVGSCPGPLSGFCLPPFGSVDSLVYNGNRTLTVSGWAVDPGAGGTTATQGVDVYYNNMILGTLAGTSVHQPRPDVVNAYQAQYPNNDFLYSGFSGTVPVPASWGAGTFPIGVKVRDLNGWDFPVGSLTSVVVPCDATMPCLSGCCSAGSCVPGNANGACGGTGRMCVQCSAANVCTNGSCVPRCASPLKYCSCNGFCETSSACTFHCSQ